MNLIERVLEEMQSDDEDTTDQSNRIVRAYDKASPAERQVVDDIFICLCGWSLATLIVEHPDTEG